MIYEQEETYLAATFPDLVDCGYQALGGIIPDTPGYRHITINPQIPEGLDWVNVSQETPYGTIVIKRNGLNLHFELPVGITATVKGDEYSCGSYDIKL